MELRQLNCFLACARNHSLTLAAEELYTTQPHVSMVIKSLEQELGTALFIRKSKGVELTEAELMKVFEKFGISKMDVMGQVFDPNFHQVIQEVEDKTKPAGTVIAELQTGYMINGRLLREAMVVVTK